MKSVVPPMWLVVALFWLSLAGVATVAMWHLRSNALDSQERELGLLSQALTDEINRTLQGVEASLQVIRAELREGHLAPAGERAQQTLRTLAQLMPAVRTLWLLDAQGRELSSSDSTTCPSLASFVPRLEGLTGLEKSRVSLSRPFAGTGTGASESLVALALPLEDTTQGWVVAAIPAAALLGAFPAASLAADARMAVFRQDGALLAGGIVARPQLDEATLAERLAALQGIKPFKLSDGKERLVAIHKLPRYGLNLLLARDLEVMLLPWQEGAQLTGAGLALLLAVLALAVYRVRRADQRRQDVQQALQTQLSRASKLESLGALAGGVAHDFNNVLAAIVGFGEMAHDAAPAGSAQARHLDKVLQAGLRGKALIERILTFSRGSANAAIVFELEPIVEEVLALLGASLRPGVVMERALDAPGARLRGDPTRIFQAVMNLCTNALQAMPNGGLLVVAVQRTHIMQPQVLSHAQLPVGHFLRLTVSDQGPGITTEVMERLFEPFFTTRSAQSGTGLGLAVVHGVVAEFGGGIDVQNTAQAGARFTLYLPECMEALMPNPIATASVVTKANAAADAAATVQTLMVVDDDAALVLLGQEMLQGMGYQTVGFTDPRAALQAVRDNPQRFSAVITDEVMPGLSGTQLAEAIRPYAPHLPLLLVSGYGGPQLASRAAAAGVSRVLSKPWQRAELARALAALLG